jgi:trk system potassium uptake protein TrkA
VAHGTSESSRVVGRKVEEIDLPRGAAIIALVRGDQVIIAHHDTVIETDDHVILFLTDRRQIERLENLFQVGVSFI